MSPLPSQPLFWKELYNIPIETLRHISDSSCFIYTYIYIERERERKIEREREKEKERRDKNKQTRQ